jgi:hypothetical protein
MIRCQLRVSEVRRVISMEEWHAIKVLKRQGHGKKAVARQLGIAWNTVKRHWDCQAPPAYQRRQEKLDPYASPIKEMVARPLPGHPGQLRHRPLPQTPPPRPGRNPPPPSLGICANFLVNIWSTNSQKLPLISPFFPGFLNERATEQL